MVPFKSLHGILLPCVKTLAELNLNKLFFQASQSDIFQKRTFNFLIRKGKKTVFGREHGFKHIKNYDDFKSHVPVMSYERLHPYIERILNGENNVLWPGKPIALASTSGTSKGPIKYIPVTKKSAPAYRKAARDSVLSYIAQTGKTHILKGKMFFMSQNPEYENISGLPAAPISGVSMVRVPPVFRKNILPSPEAACMAAWEEKLDAMLNEATGQNLTLISGIPPWLLLFFNHIIYRTGKKIGDVFPELEVIIHGGVNFEPYRSAMANAIGRPVDFIETYAATEGFIAFQDDPVSHGMLMNMAGDMFFEFIPSDEILKSNPTRIGLADVEPGRNYNVLLTTSAGLWAYDIGDTVKFVSRNPHRLMVTGRTQHYISAFGEHVIAEHVDTAMSEALARVHSGVKEYTVAPCPNPSDGGLPYHEWFIEFEKPPECLRLFAVELDRRMCEKNIVYKGLVHQKIIRPLKIRKIRHNGFRDYMKSINRIGGQNKVPRLLNHRKIADKMQRYLETTYSKNSS